MALSDISIYRDFAIINDYVQVPPNREVDKSRVSSSRAVNTIPTSRINYLSLGSGKCTGSKFGAQRFLRFPALQPGESYLEKYGYDPQQVLAQVNDTGSVQPTTDSA